MALYPTDWSEAVEVTDHTSFTKIVRCWIMERDAM